MTMKNQRPQLGKPSVNIDLVPTTMVVSTPPSTDQSGKMGLFGQ